LWILYGILTINIFKKDTMQSIMNFNTISEYDAALVRGATLPPLMEYVRDVNHRFLKVDIRFMEESTGYITRDGEFCVPHTKLWDMGVVAKTTTGNIRKLLAETHNFEECKDFICKTYKNKNGGIPSKNYFMTPYAYSICLMRSKNTRKYANYYLTLEKCVFRYDKLTNKFLNKQITIKDILLSQLDLEERKNNNTMWKLADIERDVSRKNRMGMVYLISDGRFTKVGSTYNLPKRLSSLQLANSDTLKVVGTIYCQDPNWLERHIHKDLDSKKLGIRGEWYNIPATLIKQLCELYQM
jgi:hypothetical protein